MSRIDDVLKAVQDAVGETPVYLLAGAGDFAAEKLRELPQSIEAYRELPMRAAGMVVGGAFKANLRLGQLFDELTARGHDVVEQMRGNEVVPEEDEPFVREPFMPEPVRPPSTPVADAAVQPSTAKKTVAKKTAAKKTAAKKTTAKKTTARKGTPGSAAPTS
jgi:hypothetical protein